MPETRPVIVTTDGSAHSLRILPHAALIASHMGAAIELLRVVEGDDVKAEPGEDEDAAAARTREHLEREMMADLRRAGVDGVPRLVVAPAGEDAAGALLDVCPDAAMLAMHSRGRGGIALLLQGSVALQVLKKIDLPVMLGGPELLPPPADAATYRLLLTTDLSPDADQALRSIAPLVQGGSFRVTLLHIHLRAPAGLDNEAQVAEARAGLERSRTLLPESLPVETVVREIPIGGGIDTAIMETADSLEAHAIAMATHGHSARHQVLMGSTAMSVVRRSALPVIAVRARD